MCGMSGVVGVPSIKEHHVAKMIETIRYRGVDEAGAKDLGGAVMGHARLAVVDPENGMQPMSNTDDTVWVSFNGEIYNYVELREELKQKGYKFKSRCDTEVLVHLWREEGEKMLSRLIGMYAFFIWDTKNNKGMLARDPQGIKPCFIAPYKGGWAFASEMKAILSLPDFPVEINDNGLKQVFAFNYCPPPQTCFKGITHFEPGHYMIFETGKQPVKKQFWQWPFAQSRQDVSYDDFGALIDDAVRMQMRFDVAGGMYLSGGVDSSVVAHHLIKQWNTPQLEAVGLDFSQPEYSEFENSKTAAKLLNINLKKSLISPDMIPQIAADVSWHAEQPHGDFSFFLFYILAKGAHEAGKIVMFTGDGPDETMSGFLHNQKFFHDQSRMNFSLSNYFDVICYMNEQQRAHLLNPDFEKSTDNPVDVFQSLIDPWRDLEPVEQIMAYECTSLMPANNLVKGDRMGARWSTEGRAPFMDHRLTELFVRLPVNQKFHNGIGKYYLKKYAAEFFPHDFIFRNKTMPTMPIGEWIKGPLYNWARETLAANTNERFNTKNMLALLEEHKAGAANHTRQLRTLLMTQIWLQTYFESAKLTQSNVA